MSEENKDLEKEGIVKKKIKFVKPFIVILLFLAILLLLTGGTNVPTKLQCSATDLPEGVQKIEDKIIAEANKQSVDELYHPYIIALVSQESGGRGNDPFQASESKCGKVGCISNVDESIEAGIKAFKQRIKYIESKKKKAEPELILQMYNFGSAYLDWLIVEKKEHSEESAKAFSKKMCGLAGTSIATAVNDDKTACYGDYKYIEHVSKYLDCTVEEYFESSDGFGYPFKVKYSITQAYGNPNKWYESGRHLGIDLSTPSGTPVIAVHDGVVTRMANDSTGYGSHIYVKIKKNFYIVYAHMINGSLTVKKGDKVRKGQVVGKEGSTGFSTGAHLHLEFRKNDIGTQGFNETIDPNKYINFKKRAKK